MLYLLARLTGEAGGGGAVCPRLHRQENGLGFCDREGAKSQSVFRERRQVYKPPVFRPPQGWDKVSQRRWLLFSQIQKGQASTFGACLPQPVEKVQHKLGFFVHKR